MTLPDIRFERVNATGLRLPLTARSTDAARPVKLSLETCTFRFNALQTELIDGGNISDLTLIPPGPPMPFYVFRFRVGCDKIPA